MIMKGETGRDVLAVQQALIANGYKVKADGVFGGGTQVVLRSFQVHKGLPPSGVIDQATIDCLHAESESPRNAAHRLYTKPTFSDPVLSDIWLHASAMGLAPAFWGRSFAPRILNASSRGIDFIFRLEAGTGTGESKSLHWPKGNSGVTLGPGYDMKERKQADVERDLGAIGVPQSIANAWSHGAGKNVETDIISFIAANKHSLTLTISQQKQLLKIILPNKEDLVRRWVTIDLFQFEYDAPGIRGLQCRRQLRSHRPAYQQRRDGKSHADHRVSNPFGPNNHAGSGQPPQSGNRAIYPRQILLMARQSE